ncbi:MAG TPA: VWA domain-containing protein [Aggregatilineales bacterium]|nr:VWA domain-containing protein [Aggregatilineales bacterium]
MFPMAFSNPLALLLLLVIPYFAWLGWPRLTYRRRRDIASLGLRLLIVTLIVLALSGLQLVQAADKLSVVFLVDDSDSIDRKALDDAEQYVRDAMARMRPDDRAGVVMFGKNALIDHPLTTSKDPGGFSSAPVRLETNIEGAIRVALAMFPSDTARRIVILSDGAETIGNAQEAAKLAQAGGVQIDVVPLQAQTGPEIAVTNVQLPPTINVGEQFDISVTVQSTTATSVDLTLLSAGNVVKTTRVTLKPGENNFVFSLTAAQARFTDFQARIDPASGSDGFYQNNELAGFTDVVGPPRVLLVSSKPEEIAALLPTLQGAGIQTDVAPPGDLPIGVSPLAAYKSVVLANVSAVDLTDQQMKVIQTYVRDLGGGLVVIGGPNSYGMGGYYQTPLEETLPVEMRIKDRQRIPKLLIVYVIDRSGSMEIIGPSGVTNLELSKEATRRSISFLNPEDKVGVLSFDSDPQWLVPIQPVGDGTSVVNQVGTLRPGGGTDIIAAVKEIGRSVPQDDSTLKHVILLTDGGADDTGLVQMVTQLHDKYGITMTSIGIGQDVPSFMADIARAGHGVYYNTVTLQNIPQIFVADTVFATRSYIIEQEFAPKVTANSPILRGIDAVPNLLGYIATTAKDTATVVMRAPGFDDPILAEWQYGLGRAVAWTSDATTRWSKQWASWSEFGRFWSQVIRSTIVEGANNNLESHVEQRDGASVLVVDARDDKGGLINGLDLKAAVVDPRLGAQPLKLQQVAPGQYEAPFDSTTEGAYLIGIQGQTSGDHPLAVAQTTGWVLSYSPEYRPHNANAALLQNIADLTYGKTLIGQPDLVFNHDLREEHATTALWPYMLLVALLLLPEDIAMRRLIVTRSELQKAGQWVRARIGFLERGAETHAMSARISQLMNAKVRAGSVLPPNPTADASAERDDVPAPEVTAPAAMAAPTSRASPVSPPVVHVAASPAKEPKPLRPVTRVSRPTTPPPEDEGSLASKLLERRRHRGE